ncbi:hypothetical protein EDC01DRAFT_629418 [Geopyxis carbonaria]|nr:hypothetical protein EDC01DRAFT_629418 [Geopyxis carbonaria]
MNTSSDLQSEIACSVLSMLHLDETHTPQAKPVDLLEEVMTRETKNDEDDALSLLPSSSSKTVHHAIRCRAGPQRSIFEIAIDATDEESGTINYKNLSLQAHTEDFLHADHWAGGDEVDGSNSEYACSCEQETHKEDGTEIVDFEDQKRKRTETTPDASDHEGADSDSDDDGDDGDGYHSCSSPKGFERELVGCPFFKYDKAERCRGLSFTFAKMKEHLRISQCPRCGCRWGDKGQVDRHLRRKNVCKLADRAEILEMAASKEDINKATRLRKTSGEAKSWPTVCLILFPDCDKKNLPSSSPCEAFTPPSPSTNLENISGELVTSRGYGIDRYIKDQVSEKVTTELERLFGNSISTGWLDFVHYLQSTLLTIPEISPNTNLSKALVKSFQRPNLDTSMEIPDISCHYQLLDCDFNPVCIPDETNQSIIRNQQLASISPDPQINQISNCEETTISSVDTEYRSKYILNHAREVDYATLFQ